MRDEKNQELKQETLEEQLQRLSALLPCVLVITSALLRWSR